MNDIRQMHQTLGQQSYQDYTDSLNTLNSRYGSQFGPTIPAADITRRRPGTQAPAAGQPLVIQIQNKRYRYKGTGAKSDLNNYIPLP